MKRFVTYLYEYDRTIRGRNVGFIRNDIRNDRCLMDIHIRGLERIKEKAPIYLIVRDGECIGIPAGEIVISQGIGNAFLELPGNHIGKTNYNSGDIQAVIVRYGNGKMLLGSYVQHPASDLLSGTFTKWEAQAIPETPEPSPDAARGENDDSGSIRPVSEIPRGQNDDSSSIRPVSEISRGENDDSGSIRPVSEIPRGQNDDFDSIRPVSEISRGQNDDSGSIRPVSEIPRGQNDDFDSIRPVFEIPRGQNDDSGSIRPVSEIQRGQNDNFDSTRPDALNQQSTEAHAEEKLSPPTYKRIAITDIRSLPSRNWHLCSNSFLVHGFFCYHYLVLKTVNAPDGTQIYLGVPGIYASQERMMALLFGFNDFEVDTDHITQVDCSPTEKAQTDSNHDPSLSDAAADTLQPSEGTFGYWLCQLEV